MAQIDTLRAMVEPIVTSLDADIYDLEFTGGILRLTVDRPGGIDLESIAEATRQISRQIDLDDPIPGRFTLEVTSPGLERNLRTAEHWTSAIGDRVKAKMLAGYEGERRLDGTIAAVTDGNVTLVVDGSDIEFPISLVDRARTVFEWGPTPKPGGPSSKSASGKNGAAKTGSSKSGSAKSGSTSQVDPHPKPAGTNDGTDDTVADSGSTNESEDS